MLFPITAQFVNGHLREVNWWPSLIEKREGEQVIELKLMPFEWYVSKFLEEKYGKDTMMNARRYGFKLLGDHMYDPVENSQLFVEAMLFLLASHPDIMNQIKLYMEIHGYQFNREISEISEIS